MRNPAEAGKKLYSDLPSRSISPRGTNDLCSLLIKYVVGSIEKQENFQLFYTKKFEIFLWDILKNV